MVIKKIIDSELIPLPFNFNPLKHHLGFLREFIRQTEGDFSNKEFWQVLNEIGPQLTDIYYGGFSVSQILQFIKKNLDASDLLNKAAYEVWADNEGKHYNSLELPDRSKWIFRIGEKEGRYIHFHPARLSLSVRIRGTTLKTAVALTVMAKENRALYENTEYINVIRQNALHLSPIKDIEHFTAIRKILDLIEEK